MYAVITYIANYFSSSPAVETRIIKCNDREEAEMYAKEHFTVTAPRDLARVIGVKAGDPIKTWSEIAMFSNHRHGDAVCFAEAVKSPRRWVCVDQDGLFLKVPRTSEVNRAMSTMPDRVKSHSAKYARLVVFEWDWIDAEMHPRTYQNNVLKLA